MITTVLGHIETGIFWRVVTTISYSDEIAADISAVNSHSWRAEPERASVSARTGPTHERRSALMNQVLHDVTPRTQRSTAVIRERNYGMVTTHGSMPLPASDPSD